MQLRHADRAAAWNFAEKHFRELVSVLQALLLPVPRTFVRFLVDVAKEAVQPHIIAHEAANDPLAMFFSRSLGD